MRSYLRSSIDGLLRAPRNWTRSIVVVLLGVAVMVGVSWAAFSSPSVRLALRDLHAIAANGLIPPWFSGWLVYLGAVGWFGAAAIAFFAWLVLRKRPGKARIAWMFGGFSILSMILGVDDLFMLHDGVLWIIFRFGESKLMPIWIALAVIWGLLFLPELLGNPDMLIFAGAVIFFAFGMFGDMAPDSIFGLGHEEAAKLAGIMLWALWALWTAQREVVKEFADPRLQVAATP